MEQRQKKIVYAIDPEESIGEALTVLLGTFGVDVQTFRNAEDFLEISTAVNSIKSCLVLEKDLPGMDGFSLLRQLKKRQIRVPVILLTHSASTHLRQQALEAGVVAVIEKPLINEELITQLNDLFAD